MRADYDELVCQNPAQLLPAYKLYVRRTAAAYTIEEARVLLQEAVSLGLTSSEPVAKPADTRAAEQLGAPHGSSVAVLDTIARLKASQQPPPDEPPPPPPLSRMTADDANATPPKSPAAKAPATPPKSPAAKVAGWFADVRAVREERAGDVRWFVN